MANVDPADNNDDTAQMIILGAFVIAVGVVGMAAVLNGLIFAQDLASRDDGVDERSIMGVSTTSTEAVEFALTNDMAARDVDNNGFEDEDGALGAFEEYIEGYNSQIRNSSVGQQKFAEVDIPSNWNLNYTWVVAQRRNATFENESGAKDWKVLHDRHLEDIYQLRFNLTSKVDPGESLIVKAVDSVGTATDPSTGNFLYDYEVGWLMEVRDNSVEVCSEGIIRKYNTATGITPANCPTDSQVLLATEGGAGPPVVYNYEGTGAIETTPIDGDDEDIINGTGSPDLQSGWFKDNVQYNIHVNDTDPANNKPTGTYQIRIDPKEVHSGTDIDSDMIASPVECSGNGPCASDVGTKDRMAVGIVHEVKNVTMAYSGSGVTFNNTRDVTADIENIDLQPLSESFTITNVDISQNPVVINQAGDPENFDVTVTVENNYDDGSTTDAEAWVDTDGLGQDNNNTQSINQGNSVDFNFGFTVDDTDTGVYNFELGANNSATNEIDSLETLTVEVQQENPDYGIVNLSINDPITEGDQLETEFDVENFGNTQGNNRDAELIIDGSVVDTASVGQLNPGERNENILLTWNTGTGDGGSHNATVRVQSHDQVENTVDVLRPPNFDVSVQGTNSPVDENDTLTVDARIENTGDIQDTQDITLSVGGSQRDITSVTLGGGDSTSETLEWATSNGDKGDYTATVGSDNDSASETVSVLDPSTTSPYFSVNSLSTNSPIKEGGTLDVTANIENTGGQQDTQTVSFEVIDSGGTQQYSDSVSVTLNSGGSTSESFSWATSTGDEGSYDVMVSSDDDTGSEGVEVESPDPAFFEVQITGSNSPQQHPNNMKVDAEITNTGDLQGTQTVELRISGSTVDTASVTLNSGQTTNEQFEWDYGPKETGEKNAVVRSEDADGSIKDPSNDPAKDETTVKVKCKFSNPKKCP